MNQSFFLGLLAGGAAAVGVCNYKNTTVLVICLILAATICVVAGVLPT